MVINIVVVVVVVVRYIIFLILSLSIMDVSDIYCSNYPISLHGRGKNYRIRVLYQHVIVFIFFNYNVYFRMNHQHIDFYKYLKSIGTIYHCIPFLVCLFIKYHLLKISF